MKSIRIKRATPCGVRVCEGELFEAHGFQFCITNSFDPVIYYAIEVTSGMSACKRFTFYFENEYACIKAVKQWIVQNGALFDNNLLDRSKKALIKYNIKFPLNNKI